MNRLRNHLSLWVVLVFGSGVPSVSGQGQIQTKEPATAYAARHGL